MEQHCPECGCPSNGETVCRECGYPLAKQQPLQVYQPSEQTQTSNTTKTDWAQYIYECDVIGWESFKKYAVFNGRASRREYWSQVLVCWLALGFTGGISALIFLLPIIGVSIRRMHDIGKCGWWCICPIACWFLFLKRSENGVNKYGLPQPAKNLL